MCLNVPSFHHVSMKTSNQPTRIEPFNILNNQPTLHLSIRHTRSHFAPLHTRIRYLCLLFILSYPVLIIVFYVHGYRSFIFIYLRLFVCCSCFPICFVHLLAVAIIFQWNFRIFFLFCSQKLQKLILKSF